jgi:hypothetical protein
MGFNGRGRERERERGRERERASERERERKIYIYTVYLYIYIYIVIYIHMCIYIISNMITNGVIWGWFGILPTCDEIGDILSDMLRVWHIKTHKTVQLFVVNVGKYSVHLSIWGI